jgi:hypothetical protein
MEICLLGQKNIPYIFLCILDVVKVVVNLWAPLRVINFLHYMTSIASSDAAYNNVIAKYL